MNKPSSPSLRESQGTAHWRATSHAAMPRVVELIESAHASRHAKGYRCGSGTSQKTDPASVAVFSPRQLANLLSQFVPAQSPHLS